MKECDCFVSVAFKTLYCKYFYVLIPKLVMLTLSVHYEP